jgi:hypothetical protein
VEKKKQERERRSRGEQLPGVQTKTIKKKAYGAQEDNSNEMARSKYRKKKPRQRHEGNDLQWEALIGKKEKKERNNDCCFPALFFITQ